MDFHKLKQYAFDGMSVRENYFRNKLDYVMFNINNDIGDLDKLIKERRLCLNILEEIEKDREFLIMKDHL